MKQLGKMAFALAAAVIASTTWAKSYKLTLESSNTKHGTVSGGGKYKAGTKVTINAKPKGKCVFAGWVDAADGVPIDAYGEFRPLSGSWQEAKLTITMPKRDATLRARFITNSTDKKHLKLDGLKKYEKKAYAATVGKRVSLDVGLDCLSIPTLKFKGLPKGLKYSEEEICGIPTLPGKYVVTATLKSSGGNKLVQKFKINVKVPKWARESFSGIANVKGNPLDTDGPDSYLGFTVKTYGEVVADLYYKDHKLYSFKSAIDGYTSKGGLDGKTPEVSFSPVVKIGSKKYKLGKVLIALPPELRNQNVQGAPGAVLAFGNRYDGQSNGKLLSGDLSFLNGKSYKYTKSTEENTGLTKKNDYIRVKFKKIAGFDAVDVTGVINGKELEMPLCPTLQTNTIIPGPRTVYLASIDVIDQPTKYYKKIIFQVTLPSDGNDYEVKPMFIDYD